MSKEDKKEKVRLNFDVSPELASSLKELARKKETSVKATVLSAIAVYTKIIEGGEKGSKIILRQKDGEECEIVFL